MPIPFTCPHCDHATLVEDKYAGQSGNCIECGRSVSVPQANTQGSVLSNQKVGNSATGLMITCGIMLILSFLILLGSGGVLWLLLKNG